MIRNFLLNCLICIEILISSESKANHVAGETTDLHKGQKYSFPPNNTPISKVYVFGRPVYVRQPFVVPQRENFRKRHDNQVRRDERSFGPGADELGDSIEQTFVRESFAKDFVTESDRPRYDLPERAFPSTNPYSVLPQPVEQKQRYPLPQCYTNESAKDTKSTKMLFVSLERTEPTGQLWRATGTNGGFTGARSGQPTINGRTGDTGFMCCNPKLEQVMRDAFDELSSDPRWQPCNVQKIANTLQNRTQSVFNTDFEALAGLGDFASKTHFYSDLICKIEMQGRFMLSYATPNRHQQVIRPDVADAEVVEMGSSSVGYV